MISRLKNLLNLNLDQGPYITGSYLTHLIESRYRIPIWQPNDIDLVCKSEDQLQSVNEILKSIDPNVRIDYTADTTYYYWNIDGVCIQGILHDISYVDRLNFADYTITAIVSDGENNISFPNAETDIANKILNRFNYKTFGNKAYHLKRYQKYLNRGYIDSNNYIFNEINKWYS
jgi:hypothetical protein